MPENPQPHQEPTDPRQGPSVPNRPAPVRPPPVRPLPVRPLAEKPLAAETKPAAAAPKPPFVAAQPPFAKPPTGGPKPPIHAPLAPRLAPSTAPVVLPARRISILPKLSASLAVVGVAFGGWWYVSHLPKKETPVAVVQKPAPVAAPIVERVIAPLPPLVIDRPVEVKLDAAPTPEPTIAAPDPKVIAKAPAPSTPDIYKDILILDELASRSPVVQERWAKLLRNTLRENEWSKYLDLLKRSLEVELHKTMSFDSPQRYERYTGNPSFMRAMFQYALGSAADASARKFIASDERLRQHFTVVSENPELAESFLRAWTPADNFRNAMDTWATLAADDVDAYGKYRELAIACSLVYERPKTINWNGQSVKITAAERFQWYKTKDKEGKLLAKITEMNAWKLTWVVCAPVPESEMEWAVAELGRKYKQGNFGGTYELVPYDMTKAVTGKSKTPYDYYTFAEILKKGGICGDRAYFSANTARSLGIPATPLAGDGPKGGHAWVTWLAEEDRWAFSGRIGGYPAATLHNPQNGGKLSEQRFVRMSDSHAPTEAKSLRAQRLVWMYDVQEAVGQRAAADFALEFAVKASPHEADLWEKKIQAWGVQVPPPAAAIWKPFLDGLRREFRDDTDMLAVARKAEDLYVLAKIDAASAKNELRGDVRDLAKLKGLTSEEEIRTAYKRYAAIYTKTNDYASLRHVYRDGLDDYGKEAAKFKGLAHDYWGVMKEAPAEMKTSACRDIEGAYERHVETRGGDFFDVKSQNSAAQVVAECWREAGDTARAEKIEKAIAKRGKKSTKAATEAL